MSRRLQQRVAKSSIKPCSVGELCSHNRGTQTRNTARDPGISRTTHFSRQPQASNPFPDEEGTFNKGPISQRVAEAACEDAEIPPHMTPGFWARFGIHNEVIANEQRKITNGMPSACTDQAAPHSNTALSNPKKPIYKNLLEHPQTAAKRQKPSFTKRRS